MALNFLKSSVHFDVNYKWQFVRYFLHATISESIVVRKISMKILVFILVQNKPKFAKVQIDPSQYSKVETKHDKIQPGIREDNKWLLFNSKTVPKLAKEWDETRFIHDQYTGYYVWPKQLEVYESSSKQITPVKRMDSLNETEREIYNFFSDEHNVETLIKYLSMEDKKGRDQFNIYRFFTFKVSNSKKVLLDHPVYSMIFYFRISLSYLKTLYCLYSFLI